jgi:two-component system cell cycle sensor histidine kinase/response regulator CckA
MASTAGERSGAPASSEETSSGTPSSLPWVDALIDASPTAMGFISSRENRYVRANEALLELYGIPRDELLNTDPYTLALRITHPDDLVPEQNLFAELASGARRSYRYEKRVMRPDGTFRWGLLTMAALFEPPADGAARPGLLGVTVQVVDVTERKLLEGTVERLEGELRHAQRIDALGRLSAGVAHDFNNLLTVVTGHCQALKGLLAQPGADLPSFIREAEQDLEAVLAAAERGAALTAQLLSHGRRAATVPRAFVLSDQAAALERLLSRTLGANAELEHSFAAKGAISADPAQVGQVVMNLVLNARDAVGDQGHIRLETRDVSVAADGASGGVPPGEWVALVVSDDGHGMSDDVKARMFEPFFTTREERPGLQGNGLGLATVQRIVTDAHGHIAVESAPGRGTSVTVFFPRAELPPVPTDAAKPVATPPPPNSQRVLVIEDDPAVRSLLGNVLIGAHYRVSVARDGAEGLRMLENERESFHLIVTDLVMPRIGGLELATALRERGCTARMLFISGYSDHAPGELSPYGSLLPKPFTPEQLLSAVARALGAV